MKGKFIKPTLKKVSNLDSKYENNFAKLKILVSTFSVKVKVDMKINVF